MHLALVLLQLSLWISDIYALPSLPSRSNGESRGSSITSAAFLKKPRDGFVTFKLTKKSTRSDDNVRRGTAVQRDNTYSIDTADQPTVSDSAGIDQDGTDYSYFVEAKLGSEGKSMYMLLDTGASTTWVYGSGCTAEACSEHNTFGSDDSTTYDDTGKTYTVEYGTAVSLSFGVANTTSDDFNSFAFDGIMGLSMGADTWLTAVRNAGLIDHNVFGVSLARAADGDNDGEIVFGTPDPAKYAGDVSYTTLNQGSTWTIPMDDVTVGGDAAGVTGRSAYLDTGTTFIFGPPDDVAKMYALIPGSAASSGSSSSTWTVPCDSDSAVAFTFSGRSWALSAKDFVSAPDGDGVCTGNVYGMEYVEGAWLLGDTFLKNVYSIYDVDERRIGLASKAAASGNVSTESVSSSSTGTATSTAGTAASTGLGVVGGTAAGATSTATSTDQPSAAGKLASQGIYALIACFVTVMAMVS
ncbi:acid protease [Xylariaceae sp. FL0804]|nr:acid protease [Xylariaceae sp. FL0804]